MLRGVRTVYLCDPSKNNICKRSCCSYFGLGDCEETFNKDFAKLNEKGDPIVSGRIFCKEENLNEERTT